MNSTELVESFSEFKDLKNIDRPTMMKVLEDVFRTLLRKKYGSDENFDIIVNTEKGDLEICDSTISFIRAIKPRHSKGVIILINLKKRWNHITMN